MTEDPSDRTWASRYDESLPPGVAESAVEEAALLAEIAGSGPAVEIGVGTGRVALELVRHGVDVIGIDSSPAMLDQLRQKPDAAKVQVVVGDFIDVELSRQVPLVYCVFGTFFQLGTPEKQLRCFEVAKDLLSTGGRLVLEVPVPNLNGFVNGERVSIDRRADGSIKLIAIERHEPTKQRLDTEILVFQPGGRYDRLPLTMRYVYPDELDLMARLAGLDLLARWSDWAKTSFGGDSGRHVSVYGAGR